MTIYQVLNKVSEKDRECTENVKNVLNDALESSKYFKVKEIKFLTDSIKMEFENGTVYEERKEGEGIKTSFDIEKLGLKGKEMEKMLVESKFIVSAMSDIKNQILEQIEIKER